MNLPKPLRVHLQPLIAGPEPYGGTGVEPQFGIRMLEGQGNLARSGVANNIVALLQAREMHVEGSLVNRKISVLVDVVELCELPERIVLRIAIVVRLELLNEAIGVGNHPSGPL